MLRYGAICPIGNNSTGSNSAARPKPAWYYDTARFAKCSLPRAIFQLLNTLIPYFLLLGVIIYWVGSGFPYGWTLPLSIIEGLLLVRIFIIFHDCCHNSFFAWRPGNKILGYFCGFLTCTPYRDWQWTHSRHHSTAADLDNRSYGSVWTLTVSEYHSAPVWTRFRYRLYRHPLVMLVPGPLIMFLLVNRFPTKGVGRSQRLSVWITNVAVVLMFTIAVWQLGFWDTCRIAIPIIFVSSAIGVWLFYVQHQFEGVHWFRHDQWNIMKASLEGCSYYKLPHVLHWFTGNIGIHHIHHVRTAIPNYHLQRCFNETPQLQAINVLTIRQSLRSLRLNLWDEEQGKLVSFRSI